MSTIIDLDNLQSADRAFLKQLTEDRNHIIYIKLTLLDRNSQPIDDQTLIGTPTGGSINIEGNSSIRRSCNLTMVSNNVSIKENDWVYKRRFKAEIGLENHIDSNYEDIIWFPQGEFVITSFSASIGVNNCNISIAGQDKMCLLNGEAGGILTVETDFAIQEEYSDDGVLTKTEVPLANIIKNIMVEYGEELESNLELNLPTNAAHEVLEYRGNTPAYIIYNKDKKYNENDKNYYPDPINITIHGDQPCWEEGNAEKITLAQVSSYWKPENDLSAGGQQEQQSTTLSGGADISFDGDNYNYKIQEIEYGEIAGYRDIPLVATDDLIGAIGEPVTNILDNIHSRQANYEFYLKYQ